MTILAEYKYIYQGTPEESLKYFANDNLGSSRVTYDLTGVVEDKYRYSAYGVLSVDTGSADTAFFTGKQRDATGLYYFNARYYDPKTGRFLQEDPASQGNSWYTYCLNDPINKKDEDGKDSKDSISKFENFKAAIADFFDWESIIPQFPSWYAEELANATGFFGGRFLSSDELKISENNRLFVAAKIAADIMYNEAYWLIPATIMTTTGVFTETRLIKETGKEAIKKAKHAWVHKKYKYTDKQLLERLSKSNRESASPDYQEMIKQQLRASVERLTDKNPDTIELTKKGWSIILN